METKFVIFLYNFCLWMTSVITNKVLHSHLWRSLFWWSINWEFPKTKLQRNLKKVFSYVPYISWFTSSWHGEGESTKGTLFSGFYASHIFNFHVLHLNFTVKFPAAFSVSKIDYDIIKTNHIAYERINMKRARDYVIDL